MTELLGLLTPLIGILGVVLGFSLNELMRRRNRREAYAPKIFEKRLTAYEGLANEIYLGTNIAQEVMNNLALTADERHALISATIEAIAEYISKNQLYIDQELGSHCTALFMGVEDIREATDGEREELTRDYNSMRNEALRMISEDSGVAEINRLFKTINRPKISGPLIERIRELRREQARR